MDALSHRNPIGNREAEATVFDFRVRNRKNGIGGSEEHCANQEEKRNATNPEKNLFHTRLRE